MIRPPARSTLFPYTPLFRSLVVADASTGPASVAGAVVDRVVGFCSSLARRCRAVAALIVPSACDGATPARQARRSEEHTSELQSQSNLVCRLLLEKNQTYAA